MNIEENPLVNVQVVELVNDFNYSNPTGYFNLSLPHIEFRTSMYQTMSYTQYRKQLHVNELKASQRKVYKEDEEAIEEEEKINDETSNPQNEQSS